MRNPIRVRFICLPPGRLLTRACRLIADGRPASIPCYRSRGRRMRLQCRYSGRSVVVGQWVRSATSRRLGIHGLRQRQIDDGHSCFLGPAAQAQTHAEGRASFVEQGPVNVATVRAARADRHVAVMGPISAVGQQLAVARSRCRAGIRTDARPLSIEVRHGGV